ncbi:MAG: glycoside hydrolase family 88 protein [Bacteroidota bacterium]
MIFSAKKAIDVPFERTLAHFRRRSVFQLSIFLLSSCLFASEDLSAQEIPSTIDKLKSVAGAVLSHASFEFVDKKDGKHYSSADAAPADAQLQLVSPANDWRYWNGVLNIAMIETGEALHDSAYTNFSIRNIAFSFDNYQYFAKKYRGESKWEYPFGQMITIEDLDDCGAMGASLIEVYRLDRQSRYRSCIDQLASYITTKQVRYEDSTLVRPDPLKWTIWADDLYMSVSFLARMGELTGDARYFDDAAKQVVNFHKHLFDESKGLIAHFWYSDVNRQGVAFWGRANGWAMMAQVNLLDRLPKNHPMRDTLIALLRRHIFGIARWQSGDGLWHQLLDKEDSFLETSCSAMFTYAIARSVNKGYLEQRYSSIALRGWEGVASKILPDGEIEGVSAGTGISDDLVYYYHRPTPLNDPHGTGAVLLAGTEVLRLPK